MVALLSRLPVEDSLKLCHRVVDGLCGRDPPHRGDYSATWSLEEWLELLSSLVALFHLAVGNKSSDEEVLAGLSDVGSGHAETVLNLALSSDKISSLHTPLLSLNLDVREDGALRPVTMEMNRDELNVLINSLEAANKSPDKTGVCGHTATCPHLGNLLTATTLVDIVKPVDQVEEGECDWEDDTGPFVYGVDICEVRDLDFELRGPSPQAALLMAYWPVEGWSSVKVSAGHGLAVLYAGTVVRTTAKEDVVDKGVLQQGQKYKDKASHETTTTTTATIITIIIIIIIIILDWTIQYLCRCSPAREEWLPPLLYASPP
ncbi:hypothetical protein INR49_014740 [Caranx melampygus]|nr:hypothetical protein INR49_014740 [Caranx melampygus]